MEIPVIDFEAYELHRSKPDAEKLKQLVSDVDKAFRGNGIAYIVNHGVSRELIETGFRQFKEFCALPLETKNKYARPENEIHGYLGFEKENFNPAGRPLPDHKECFNYYPPMKKELIYSEDIQDSGKTMFTLWSDMTTLYIRLLEITSLALDIDVEKLMKLHRGITDNNTSVKNNTTVRYAFYPALKASTKPKERQVRFGEHTDYGCYSFVVCNDVRGFEFQDTSGEWIPVPPNPDALIVLPSNCIQRMTSDKYRAVPHRGVFVEGQDSYTDRLSINFFGTPDNDAILECLDGSGKYKPVSYFDYLQALFHEKY
ncbi:uncharacterized protein LOC144445260 [Glandiceps talaboti]